MSLTKPWSIFYIFTSGNNLTLTKTCHFCIFRNTPQAEENTEPPTPAKYRCFSERGLNIDNVQTTVTLVRPPAQFNAGINKSAVLHLCNCLGHFFETVTLTEKFPHFWFGEPAVHIMILGMIALLGPLLFSNWAKVRCLPIGGKCGEVSPGAGKQEIYEWHVPNLFLAQGSDKHPAPCPNSSLGGSLPRGGGQGDSWPVAIHPVQRCAATVPNVFISKTDPPLISLGGA